MERAFDRAWLAILADERLAHARQKLSIHELRTIIGDAVAAAIGTPEPDTREEERAADAPLPREEAERLLALCEAEQQARENVKGPESIQHYRRMHAEFNHAALDALPRALREVLRLRERVEELEYLELWARINGLHIKDAEKRADWMMTQMFEGLLWSREAVKGNGTQLRTYLIDHFKEQSYEIARLRRALDAAGIVLGSEG